MSITDEMLLRIIAQDEYSKDLALAREMVDAMTESEKESIKVASDLADQNQSVAEETDRMASAMATMQDVVGGVQLAVGKLKEVWEFGQQGAAIERINAQWEATAQQFNFNANDMINALDRVTKGTVDDEAMMQTASKAFTQGIVTSQDEIVKAMEFARAASVRFGGSTLENFDKIIQSANMLSTRGFKQLGVQVDSADQAIKDYAKAHGIAADQVDDDAKKHIFLNAALAKTQDLVKSVGAGTMDSVDKYARLEKQLGDVGDAAHTFVADALNPILTGLTSGAIMADQNASAYDRLAAAQDVAAYAGGAQAEAARQLIPYLQAQADELDKQAEAVKVNSDAWRAWEAEHADLDHFSRAVGAAIADTTRAVEYQYQSLNLSAAEVAKVQAEANKAADAGAISFEKLAQSLMGASKADLARAAIADLDNQLQNGEISRADYQTRVETIGLKFGLMTQQSIAAAEALQTIDDYAVHYGLSAQGQAEAIDRVNKASADGIIKTGELGKEFDKIKQKIEETQEQFNLLREAQDRIERQIDITITTHYTHVGDPNSPLQGGYAGGGIIGAAAGMRVLAGEFGAEPVTLPVGSQVTPAPQINNYITNQVTTDEMGMALFMNQQEMLQQSAFNARMK